MNNTHNTLWQARFLLKSNWLGAVRVLKQGLKNDPYNYHLLEQLGEIYVSKKLYKKAISAYQRILRRWTNDANALFRLGNCYMSLGQHELGLGEYKKIKEFIPEAIYNKAIALNRANLPLQAIAVLERLVQSNALSELPFFFLCELYISHDRPADAIYLANKMEAQFGRQGGIYFRRGFAYMRQENYLRAFVEFENAQKMRYESARFYHAFGITADKIGRSELGINLLWQSIKLSPSSSWAYRDLLNIYIRKEMLKEALALLNSAKDIPPLAAFAKTFYQKIKYLVKELENN